MSELTPLQDFSFSTALTPAPISGSKRGTLQWIALDKLFIDKSYQRDVGGSGKANIRRIVENFAWHLFSPLIVSPRPGGCFAVIDGQHRAIAAKLHGHLKELPCLVLHCSHEDEAQAFAVINGNVTKVSPQYLFRARLAAGEKSAVGANRAAEAAGVRILLSTYSAQQVKFNETQAPSTIESCYKTHGERVLTAALTLIVRASKSQRGCLRGGSIIAFCDLFRDNPRWLARLDEAISCISSYSLLKLVNECMAKDPNDTGVRGGMRSNLIRRGTELLRARLGDGGKPPAAQKPEMAKPKAQQAPAPDRPKQQALADSLSRPASQSGLQPQKPKPVPSGLTERELIEHHLKTRGVRKFDTADTADPSLLVDWLVRVCKRNAKRVTGAGGSRTPFDIDGKRCTPEEFFEIVNTERKKRKLQPITLDRAA